jgi:tetratricopeptide (TPR) repeat protein
VPCAGWEPVPITRATTRRAWTGGSRLSGSTRPRIPGSLVRRSTIFLTIALIDAGELADAQLHCGRALSLARQAGALFDQADGLLLMTNIDLQLGSLPEARAHLREAMDLTTRIGHDLLVHDCLDAAGHLCAQTRRYAEAITVWAADAALRQDGGYPIRRTTRSGGRSRCERAARLWAQNELAPHRHAERP